MPKSEIISITSHNSDSGMDGYDSCDEEQQWAISFATDNHQQPKRGKVSPKNFLLADDPRFQNLCFQFFP